MCPTSNTSSYLSDLTYNKKPKSNSYFNDFKIDDKTNKINKSISQELVEVKNTYIHPRYRYGELHADIALLELGRRVEFKLDEFGDTPICLDKGLDLPGKVAIAQVDFNVHSATNVSHIFLLKNII